MRVLSVASECVPLIKTGGLADVVGALPGVLAAQGVEMRVMLPAYAGILDKLEGPLEEVWADWNLYSAHARLLKGRLDGLTVLALDAPHLYHRDGGPYADTNGDYWDNPERFAALCWAAAAVAREGMGDGWKPDILHAHDWQAGLAPAYLRYFGDGGVKSVITIHNIAFQGVTGGNRLEDLHLPWHAWHPDHAEYHGNISTLKAGLSQADAITTVSPTYAEELMRPEFGMGLEGVIAARADDLHGILNGVEAGTWAPETDTAITPYSADTLKEKTKNRDALRAEFGLDDIPGPLAIVVSRLTWQKGIDLLIEALPAFIEAGGGLALLGSGERHLEQAVQDAARRWPGRVGVKIGYDEDLSHRMFGGGDAVIVPSRFEPCGLTQMYGLKYGTVPVVAATGGLNDTVIGATPASLSANAATGISFHPVDTIALSGALRQLIALYGDRAGWTRLVKRAMKAEVGWEGPAKAYADLYRSLTA
ncbi:glycogen synthase GlgA [Sinisalibacter aestuarii]|uniref:Glycogen synthase n=1 Tax=Sinisalibacter aestuarii TaxID=2949426 RepID=A0ABQ5LNL9_9RHOB|nr:glycogen synthase GlgA [Sinisalibacter aestuarii]GKY86558.1 glycogen synthase [Sinisalibacter aestuarii]